MRTVIQRVSHASVSIGCHCKSAIQGGLLILLGIEEADNEEDIDWLCRKITGLRIFDDENGVMNRSILETGGSAGNWAKRSANPCRRENSEQK